MGFMRATACLVMMLALPGCARRHADVPAAVSADPQPAASVTPAAAAAGGGAGVRIFIDPVTGEVRAPTAAERAAEVNATRRIQADAAAVKVAPDVVVTSLPGGITEYSVNGGAQVDETTCVQKDGKLGECSAAQKAALRAAPVPEHK
jgi:hypothetical protein